jgi:uncharacterized damage-inducible protein DinB
MKYKKPQEYAAKPPRTPVSARVKETSKETLEKAAKRAGMPLAELLAHIVDDYADWLDKRG